MDKQISQEDTAPLAQENGLEQPASSTTMAAGSAAPDRETAPDSVQHLRFPNKNTARLLFAAPEADPNEIVRQLGLETPQVLLLMLGGTEPLTAETESYLTQLFSRGIARSLAEMQALVIDSGCKAGTIPLMGQGVVDRGRKTALLGIAPAGRVTYPGDSSPNNRQERQPLDANHSHFVLVEGREWGDETETLFQVADMLARESSTVTLLVGGDGAAKQQVLRSVRRGWPVIVINGSGGLADEVAQLAQTGPQFIPDPALAEIIIDGKIYFIQLAGPISAFERLLEQLVSYQDTEVSTLELVWQRFALYDQNASRQQRDFNQVQTVILVLGVLGTFLALAMTTFKNSVDLSANSTYFLIDRVMFYILLLIPISISVLIAAANRFSAGNKWILLRASAESLKKEIYRYRARVEIYSDRDTQLVSREMKLHRKEEILSRKLMQTEVNVSALKPYKGPIPPENGAARGDDGLSFLTPERYVDYRLDDQLAYYQRKTVSMERQLKRLQWLIYIFGGLGTLLVAINQELWIAFTTAMVTALSTFMEYRQLENTLIRYNQTAAELASIRSWWIALSAEEKADPQNIDKLVGQTETTIYSEHAAWVQEMQDAMAELRAEQSEDNKTAQPGQTPVEKPPKA